MSKWVPIALAPGMCALVLACGSTSIASENTLLPASAATFSHWPHVSGRVGSYDIQTTGEVSDMAADGLTLLLKSSSTQPPMANIAQTAGVRLIDDYPWSLVNSYGCHDFFAKISTSCQISDATADWIISKLQAHLDVEKSNKNVVAYWFLDDYPGGDISSLLQRMHDVLAAANSDPSSSFPRPAICGFGGRILPLGYTRISGSDQLLSYFRKSITNFRPSYCDMVALYPYAVNTGTAPNDPSHFDWSMTYLLPTMFRDLREHGWDVSAEPLVGFAQAFGYLQYVAPTGADLSAQMAAYCKAGAVALMVYSWDDGYPSVNPEKPSAEPSTSNDMRSGIAHGLTQCRRIWPSTRS